MPSPHRDRMPYRHYKVCAECPKPVTHWSRFCKGHARRLQVYGHARAKPVRHAKLIDYAAKAVVILDKNAHHEGVQLALGEIEGLLNDAREQAMSGQTLAPDYALWLGLAQRAITARLILAMVCAAVLYEHLSDDPAIDKQAYEHRVARAVLMLGVLKPKRRDLPAGPQRVIGRMLIDRYSPLVVNVLIAVRAAERERRQRHDALAAPLK